jgi:ribonuclease T
MNKRFRGFLPVVIDVEAGGFNAKKDALLEMAAIFIEMDEDGHLYPGEPLSHHIIPFKGSHLDPQALEFNKIDPFHPFRFAVPEEEALSELFERTELALERNNCNRAVLVGHNAWFDLSFIVAAANRCKYKKIPFHSFTSLDTATLSGLVYGQTVLAKALKAAGIPYDVNEAHSALYDARCTAELFCKIVNQFKQLGGWPK